MKNRLKLYKEIIPKLLSNKNTEFTIEDLGIFDKKYERKEGRITLVPEEHLNGENSTVHYKLKIREGILKTSDKDYKFNIKYTDNPENELGKQHLLENLRSDQELDRFNVPFKPLSFGDISPILYLFSEDAGDPIYRSVESDLPIDVCVAIVANNIFGISEETLNEELDLEEELDKIYFIKSEKLIRPNKKDKEEDFANLFQKGIDRLINQTDSRYNRIFKTLDEVKSYAAEKNLEAQRNGVEEIEKDAFKADLENVLKDIEQDRQRIEHDKYAFLDEIKKKDFRNKYSTQKIPIIFLPTDLVSFGMHIRIKNIGTEEKPRYRAYAIDGVLGENESSAGSPREVYEKIKLAKPAIAKQFEEMPVFLDKLCDMIKIEYLGENPNISHWMEYDEDIKEIVDFWRKAKTSRSNIDRITKELKGSIDTIFIKYTSQETEEE